MLLGFLLGIVHDRQLMWEAQVNIAIRWFIGYGPHEVLPDHSSLTRIRQRWGAERFRKIFERKDRACVAAKIASNIGEAGTEVQIAALVALGLALFMLSFVISLIVRLSLRRFTTIKAIS